MGVFAPGELPRSLRHPSRAERRQRKLRLMISAERQRLADQERNRYRREQQDAKAAALSWLAWLGFGRRR